MSYKNRYNIDYWLRKIYTSKFFQLLWTNKATLKKKIFTSIYKSNHWVQDEDVLSKEFISVSGHGSNLNTEQFYNLVKNFTKIINKYDINSIIDMPCGDFLWIKEIIKNKNIEYLGIDIVEELIEENKKKYQDKKIKFECHDIVNFSTIKELDLILIRDLFIHIKNSEIKKIIHNIKNMNFKYVMLNSYNNKENKDVVIGQHRKVNLLIEPFNMKKPTYTFKDHENDKFVFFYERSNFI